MGCGITKQKPDVRFAHPLLFPFTGYANKFASRGGFFASWYEAQVPGKEVLYKEKP